MKYGAFPYRVIHFDPIDNLLGVQWVDNQPLLHYEIYSKSEKEELPILFRWTYRMSKNSKDIFSCVGEGRYVITFEKGENPEKELDLLIGTSHINLEMRWEDETRQTPLFGTTLKPAGAEEKNKVIQQIIAAAKEQGLL